MAVNGMNFTYPDVARRESLLDIMGMLDPTETQLLTGLQSSVANNTLHEWTLDTLEAVATNAQGEGADAPTDAAADPTRPQNVTQIFAKTAKVTGSENADNLKRVGGQRMARELMKKMKALKNDIEFALVRGSIASGLASTNQARQLAGIKNWITSNTSNYSGATLDETTLNDMFQAAWNRGAMIDAVYAPMKGKRRISGFTAGTTKQTDVTDRRLILAVDVYQADAAKLVKLFPHRHVTISGDYGTTATPGFDILALQEDTWAVAYYRKPFTKDIAETGDFTAKELITELTLEARQQGANVYGKVLF